MSNKDIDLSVNLEFLKGFYNTFNDAVKVLDKAHFDNELLKIEQDNQTFEDEKKEPIHTSIIPRVVMLSFTIELGLKTFYFRENGKWLGDKKHSLKYVFEKLSQPLQDQLKEKTCTAGGFDETEFNNALTNTANSFVEWRYLFDKMEFGDTQNVSFLFHFNRIIKKDLLN